MSLAQHIRGDFKAARIARDDRVKFYSTVVGEIEKIEKATGVEALNTDVITILRKFKKGIDDTLALPNLAEAQRDAYALEGRWIDAYLPRLFDEDELGRTLRHLAAVLGIAIEPKATGVLMKALNEQFPGQIDGKLASRLIRGS